ncbi:MAG: helix-turn-helix domain-containing protein [Methylorubrum populi]
MVKRTPLTQDPCPIARSLDQIGDWWTLLIVRNALHGARRFGEFRKELGVSKSMLSTRLAQMVEHGILEQRPDPNGSAYGEYHLTEKGRQLWMVLVALRQWGEANLFQTGEAMTVLQDRRNGSPTRRLALMAADGQVLQQADTDVRLGVADIGPRSESEKEF